MKVLPERHLQSNLVYYQHILVLSEIGGKSPTEISAILDPDIRRPAEKITSDLERLTYTMEKGALPDEYDREFKEIIGTRDHLEEMRGVDISASTPSWESLSTNERKTIDNRVRASLAADREVGFSADLVSEWFYRRLYTERLAGQS
jgi:hypothetical protein